MLCLFHSGWAPRPDAGALCAAAACAMRRRRAASATASALLPCLAGGWIGGARASASAQLLFWPGLAGRVRFKTAKRSVARAPSYATPCEGAPLGILAVATCSREPIESEEVPVYRHTAGTGAGTPWWWCR